MSYSIQKHLEFNAWANATIADLIKPISEDQFYRENKGSFPSIAKTTLHMWGSQYIWYRRMHGESLKQAPMVATPPPMTGILAGLVSSSKDFVQFVNSINPALLSSKYRYTTLRGEPAEDSYEETLFHVVNHSTYHRGQLVLMLREVGVTALKGTDLIHYLRANRK